MEAVNWKTHALNLKYKNNCKNILACAGNTVYNNTQQQNTFQGQVKFLTGGIAHEPQGMIRWDSEADSKVWMKEDVNMIYAEYR